MTFSLDIKKESGDGIYLGLFNTFLSFLSINFFFLTAHFKISTTCSIPYSEDKRMHNGEILVPGTNVRITKPFCKD